MRLACSTLTLKNGQTIEIEDLFLRARRENFNYIDLAMMEGWQSVNPSDIQRDYFYWLKRTRNALENSALKLCAINGNFRSALTDPDPEKHKDYLDQFKTVIAYASALKCENVVVQPGKIMAGMTFLECRNRLAGRLVELGEIACRNNIRLSIEPHKDCVIENPEDALCLLKEVYPSVGCCYDPSHFVMQGIDLHKTRDLIEYTYHVHVRNAAVSKMQEVTEKGIVNFKWLYDALKESTYDQYVTVEYFNDFDPDLKETRKVARIFEDFGCDR